MSAPDFMPDLKAWLKAHPLLAPLHGGRVFFRIPDFPVTYPLMRLYRSGGGAENRGDTPVLYLPRVGLEVWGNARSMYDQVRALEIAVETALNEAGPQLLNPPSGTTYLASATVNAVVDSPDPDEGWPRFTLDAQLVVRSA